MINTAELSLEEYRVLLRNDFVTFIERAFYELNPHTDFITGQYIDLLAATLEKCRTGQTKRLIVNLPPRTLKSHAASVAFPAWLWPPARWKEDGCPDTYVLAYRDSRWRKRIQDEKCRYRKKYDKTPTQQRESIIEGENGTRHTRRTRN